MPPKHNPFFSPAEWFVIGTLGAVTMTLLAVNLYFTAAARW